MREPKLQPGQVLGEGDMRWEECWVGPESAPVQRLGEEGDFRMQS